MAATKEHKGVPISTADECPPWVDLGSSPGISASYGLKVSVRPEPVIPQIYVKVWNTISRQSACNLKSLSDVLFISVKSHLHAINLWNTVFLKSWKNSWISRKDSVQQHLSLRQFYIGYAYCSFHIFRELLSPFPSYSAPSWCLADLCAQTSVCAKYRCSNRGNYRWRWWKDHCFSECI